MITSASILSQSLQKDGRSYIVEIQIDDITGPQRFEYLAEIGANINLIMTNRTAAINAYLSSIPTVTITEDDNTTNTIKTFDISDTSLKLTAAQKSALTTARTVITTLKPFIKVYATLTPAQKQFVLTHSPWFQQALDLLS